METQYVHRHFLPEVFKLRWRFEFSDGKAAKFGMWSRPATIDSDKACFVNKENLAVALVESKNIATGEIKTMVDCVGPDFVNFEWIGVISAFGALQSGRPTHGPIHGINIVSRNMRASVLIDGQIVVNNRHKGEEKTHLVGFGK